MKSGSQPASLTKISKNIIAKIHKMRLINSKYKNVIITISIFSIMFTGVIAFSIPSSVTAEDNISSVVTENSVVTEDNVPVATVVENKVNAYGLYIDGNFIAATNDESNIKTALDSLLKGKVTTLSVSNITKSQFKNVIKIEKSDFKPEYVVDAASLNKLLGIINENTYTFELKSVTGDKVNDVISVIVEANGKKEVEIAYETSYVDTDLKSAGYEKTVNSGTIGTGIANYKLVYVDNELVQSVCVSTDVVTEPVNEIVERGVLSAKKEVTSIGIFTYPYQGKISSYFGWRSNGNHEGIDIVAKSGSCKGDPVGAAADGVVVFAASKGGYGNVVFIDHGNGLVTLYAHLSVISVKAGDTVKTGDIIGNIGATGQASGYHLHFGIQKDGKEVDPLLYLK